MFYMADFADRSVETNELFDDVAIKEVQRKAALIPVGAPGDCVYCGEYFERVVKDHCGHCRDLLGRP